MLTLCTQFLSNSNGGKYPCKICQKSIAVNHDSIQYDRCDIWVHTKCNKINKQTYKLLKEDKSNWYCIICTKEFLPFSNLNDEEFISTIGKRIPFTALREKRKPEQEQFKKFINDLTEKGADEIKQHVPTGNNLSLYHLNISSSGYHFHELEDFNSI